MNYDTNIVYQDFKKTQNQTIRDKNNLGRVTHGDPPRQLGSSRVGMVAPHVPASHT